MFPRLDDEGGSDDVYKHPVTVKAEYDPKVRFVKLKSYSSFFLVQKHSIFMLKSFFSSQLNKQGMLVKILEDSEQKEFVVSQGSEFARVGRKGIIFKVKLLIL